MNARKIDVFSVQEVSESQISIGEFDSFEISMSKNSISQISPLQINTSQISVSEIGVGQINVSQIGISQIGISQIGSQQRGSNQTSSSKVNLWQIDSTRKIDSHPIGIAEILFTRIKQFKNIVFTQPRTLNSNPFDNSIISHTFDSSQLDSIIQYNTVNIWQDLHPNPIDINYQIIDLYQFSKIMI